MAYRPVSVAATSISGAALAEARRLDHVGQSQAVDLYFRAATGALAELRGPSPQAAATARAVYHEALAGLIDAGQRHARLDPRGRLTVADAPGGSVPIRYFGFAWLPGDFSRLSAAWQHTSRDIARHYAMAGMGLPLVVERIAARRDELFFRPWQTFAATAVLRQAGDGGFAAVDTRDRYTLDFVNPLLVESVELSSTSYRMARDLTAPLAAVVNEAPRQYLRGFTAPSDTAVQPQLVMLEPYQRGKIPVVFIHGLYSDPITWADMANELLADRALYEAYQFWIFRYPTGGDLLHSAAVLRQRLWQARATVDPAGADSAMDCMVLVGHSMGGLVSKMQVTWSYDLLWREVARRPFEALRAEPAVRQRLAEGFFFEPVGMVKFDPTEEEAYQRLIDSNPDVWKTELVQERPTTIDLLEPDSPFLNALARMPVRPEVHLHSIIGTGGLNPLEPGDGVVPISSARHYGDSELFVDATHEKLHRDDVSVAEVARILRLHAASQAQAPAILPAAERE